MRLSFTIYKSILCSLLILMTAACKSEPAPLPAVDSATLNLSITQTGIHAISTADILTHSEVKLGRWEQQTVAVTEQGKAVPFTIQDEYLLFFGRQQDSVYSNQRVYQLHFGKMAQGKSQAFQLASVTPTQPTASQQTVTRTIQFEQDNRYVSIARTTQSESTWFWDQIHVADQFEATLELPHPADGSARLTADLLGISHDDTLENDHDLDLIVNDVTLKTLIWDGNGRFSPQIDLPAGTLQHGANRIVLDNRPDGHAPIDISELDRLTFSYPAKPIAMNDQIDFETEPATLEISRFSARPIIFSILKDRSVQRLTDLDYEKGTVRLTLSQSAEVYAAGPDGWHTPVKIEQAPEGATLRPVMAQSDLIIISTDELAPELAPLIQARQQQGLSVTVTTVEEIYNRFGYGQPSPYAIQAFLADALENWPAPAPRYLLLAGGTTYDYRNNLGGIRQNRVPSMLIGVSHSGETVSDSRLADVNHDGRADFAVGRWPVQSRQQLASLVKRTLAYEQAQVSSQTLFTADGAASTFADMSNRLILASGLSDNQATQVVAEPVIDQWNKGNWLVTYVGHGSLGLWGSQPLFSNEQVDQLQPPADIAPPIVLQFTCLTGFFAHPNQASISEKMLLNENGPVLIVAATSLTYSSRQEPFAKALLSRLADPTVMRMGDAVLQAGAELDLNDPHSKEVYDTFVLLGDPSAIIGRPE